MNELLIKMNDYQGLFGIIFMWEGQVNQNKPVTFLLRSFFRIFLLTSRQFLCTRFFVIQFI